MHEIRHSEGETWDKKKIAIFLVILIVLAWIGYKTKPTILKLPPEQVQGVSIDNTEGLSFDKSSSSKKPYDSVKEVLQKKLDSIKKDVANLNIEEIATSSPQFQKIVNDLKALEQIPKNQVKEYCMKVCGSL